MTAFSNTITGATPNVGLREDLEDVIYRVAPEETPFTSSMSTVKCTNTYHEWQVESLTAPSATNAQLEGDDLTAVGAGNLTTRVGNICQILTKSGAVSRTQGMVKLAGRDDEMDRQKILKGKEIKTDFEIRAIGNYASVAESGATTRKTAGALAWITSNDNRGATGADGGFSAGIVAAAGLGTQRTLTEALVKATLVTAFNNGARPSVAYMGGTHKQQFSAFTGIADIRSEAPGKKMATIIGAADVYVGDFSNITLVPHPYGLTRDVLLSDPEYWAVGVLDGIKTKPLAETGDAEKFLMTMEKTLVCRNQKAHACVYDLT